MHPPVEQGMAEPTGAGIVGRFLEFTAVVLADRIENRIRCSGQERVEAAAQQAGQDHPLRQGGDGAGEIEVVDLLVVAQTCVMDSDHRPGTPEIGSPTGVFAHHRGQDGGVAVVAVHDIGPLLEQDHQVERGLLQQDIHGKVVEMAAAGPLPGNLQFILLGVGVHPALGGETVRLHQEDSYPVDRSLPDRHPLPPFFVGVVHVDLEDVAEPPSTYAPLRVTKSGGGEAEVGGIDETVTGQHHPYRTAAVGDKRLGQLTADVLDPAGTGQPLVLPCDQPHRPDGVAALFTHGTLSLRRSGFGWSPLGHWSAPATGSLFRCKHFSQFPDQLIRGATDRVQPKIRTGGI